MIDCALSHAPFGVTWLACTRKCSLTSDSYLNVDQLTLTSLSHSLVLLSGCVSTFWLQLWHHATGTVAGTALALSIATSYQSLHYSHCYNQIMSDIGNFHLAQQITSRILTSLLNLFSAVHIVWSQFYPIRMSPSYHTSTFNYGIAAFSTIPSISPMMISLCLGSRPSEIHASSWSLCTFVSPKVNKQ